MIDELFLYDRDKGLFKEILKQSTVIQGRYYIAPNYGHELNSANLDSFISDPTSGLKNAGQKYPCAVLLPIKSRLQRINGETKEDFIFSIAFLCTTGFSATGQIKRMDASSVTSEHHVWFDWKDMKECAVNFIHILDQVIRQRDVDGNRLLMLVNLDLNGAMITRLSKVGNDRISGVSISFSCQLAVGECHLTDYPENVFDNIVMPSLTIHSLHKH